MANSAEIASKYAEYGVAELSDQTFNGIIILTIAA